MHLEERGEGSVPVVLISIHEVSARFLAGFWMFDTRVGDGGDTRGLFFPDLTQVQLFFIYFLSLSPADKALARLVEGQLGLGFIRFSTVSSSQ